MIGTINVDTSLSGVSKKLQTDPKLSNNEWDFSCFSILF